ncbi:hypothetical protein Cgig2_015675 [Carnegiea gigantea]|uniref:MLO-like protein n=1 Tax=Carnegiea gigantea TaxID=171969 RepID=A0A9Q1GPV9_9CARY|nr:hypothetical protein Cgig2_015675 [Carnegiea gigantea]
MAEGEEGSTLEYTPTWVVAIVCTIIVIISLGVERSIHYTGKYLKKVDKKPLYQALEKIKEGVDGAELMIMGFISLLLTVFQSRIGRICVSEDLANKWLPCEKKKQDQNGNSVSHAITIPQQFHATRRHLLSGEGDPTYCQKQLAFFKQFYGSVTKSDYITMRFGFIMLHLKGNHKFNFHNYMVRAFESDFKKVVGIRLSYLFLARFHSIHAGAFCMTMNNAVKMGSSFNKAIFEDYIREGLVEWAHEAKRNRTTAAKRLFANGSGHPHCSSSHQKGTTPKEESTVVVDHNPTVNNIHRHDQDHSLVGEIQPEQIPLQDVIK